MRFSVSMTTTAHSHSAGSRGLYLSTITMETLPLLPRPSPPLRRAQTSPTRYDVCFHGNRPDKTWSRGPTTMQGSRCFLLVPDRPARGGVHPAHSSRGPSISNGNKSTSCSLGVRHRGEAVLLRVINACGRKDTHCWGFCSL